MDDIKLTHFSHGAGCGCKISPAVLSHILQSKTPSSIFPNLIVGNESNDDAAVYDWGDGTCLISTTDFFMPIVDDAFTFGAISSVNAISDVYAMGGDPLLAIAILGWPIQKIDPDVAQKVLEGSRKICDQAGIPLAGGHSIDCPEPIFGLAVSGKLKKEHLKRNNQAKVGSWLYLTKPLGVGILTTAQKKGIVTDEHLKKAIDSMLTLNQIGAELGKLSYVNAMTDITGFGLLGHLTEVCEASNLSAKINFDQIPKFNFLFEYITQQAIPGGTLRNWESYGNKIGVLNDTQKMILADPQTSGGLLICVDENKKDEFEKFAQTKGHQLSPFGRLSQPAEKVILIN